MPTSTTNYGLIKPGTDDPILIEQLNDNADTIDAALKENADAIENKPDAADIPTPSTAAPAMDGTAAAGTSTDYARADHIHPSDTSKQDALSAAQLAAVNSGIDSTKVEQIETNKNNISMLTADMSKVQTGLGAVCVLRSNKSSSTTYTYTMSIDDFSVPPSISIGSSGTYLVSILTWSTTPTYSMYAVSYSGGGTTTYNLVQKISGADANVTCTGGVITITSNGKVQIYALR